MHALTNFFIRNYTFTVILTVLVLVVGFIAYKSLPVEQVPDIIIPYIVITTVYPTASPEDIEHDVTDKIEEYLDQIDDKKSYESYSAEGLSLIFVEYVAGYDIDNALRDVRDQVELARSELPEDAEEPVIKAISTSDIPTLILSISSSRSEKEMRNLADCVEKELERIPGISRVDVFGTRDREVHIELKPEALERFEVTLTELINAIKYENTNIPAGNIDLESTRYALVTKGRFTSLEDIRNLVVKVKGGSPVFLRDIAVISDGMSERVSYGRLNGKPSINFSIYKKDDANTIETSRLVADKIEQLRPSFSEDIELAFTGDQAAWAKNSMKLMLNSALSGALPVVILIFLFLGFRNSLLTSLAIPISLSITFIWLMIKDYSFNSVTLFGLVLVIGILVDDAIIIVEDIYRMMENGKTPRDAAEKASKEVGSAILFSALTTIAAFAPLLLMTGTSGQFMKYIPITVISSIIGAVFAAHTLIPGLASRMMRISKLVKHRGAKGGGWFYRVKKKYGRILNFLLRKPLVFPSIIFTLWLVSIGLIVGGALDFEFFPELPSEKMIFKFKTASGTSLDETDRILKIAEDKLAPYRERLKYITANVGEGGGRTENFDFSGNGATYGEIHTELMQDDMNYLKKNAPEIENAVKGIPGVDVELEVQQHGPPVDTPVVVRIKGDDFAELDRLSKEVTTKLESVKGLKSVFDNFDASRPEISVTVDRTLAADLALSPYQIASAVRMAFYGLEVSKFFDQKKNESVDIMLKFPDKAADNPTQLLRMRVINALGIAIPLNRVAKVDFTNGIETIIRRNGLRTAEVRADVEGISPYKGLALARAALADLQLPSGYSMDFAGENEERDESFQSLGLAMLVALFAVYLLLVLKFESAIQPLVVMGAIPFSMIGVVFGMLLMGFTFSVMPFIGVIALAGYVVNDAIVLINYTNQLRTRGMKKVLAIRKACLDRMRPVLLTSITTIFGILPLATGWATGGNSSQSLFWAPLGWAFVFGLIMSTILVLLIVPSIYLIFTYIEEEWIPNVFLRRNHIAETNTSLSEINEKDEYNNLD